MGRQHQAAKKIQQFMKKTHLKPYPCLAYSWRVTPERPGCFTCRKREGSPTGTAGSHLPPKLSAAPTTAAVTAAAAAAAAATSNGGSTHHEDINCSSGGGSHFHHG